MSRVAELRQRGEVAVVQVDLDLTSLLPVERTMAALRQVGAQYGIPEFQDPARLPVLPGYTNAAFDTFLTELGLRQKYPQVNWGDLTGPDSGGAGAGSLYGAFRGAYWSAAPVQSDVAAPGLLAFVRAVEAAGGKVVFVSNRPGAAADSIASLRAAGIEHPILFQGAPPGATARPPAGVTWNRDQTVKAAQQEAIARIGRTIAVVDDRAANRDAIVEALGQAGAEVLSIAIAAPRFTADAKTKDTSLRISTFEGE